MLTALAKKNILDPPVIEDVSFLGSSEKIAWKYEEENGLLLTASSQATDPMATVIKITVSK